MSVTKAFRLLLALAVGLSPLPASAQESGFFFRSSNTGVIDVRQGSVDPGPVTPEEPEEPGDGGDPGSPAPLSISHAMPATAAAGIPFTFELTAEGGEEGGYAFSAAGLPHFMSVSGDGTVTATPMLADEGLWEGIVFSVTDGTGTASTEPLSMAVTGTAPFPMPAEAFLNGEPFDHTLLYDGSTTTVARIAGPDVLEYRFDDPVEATGFHLHTNRSAVVEAFVEGQWTVAAAPSGSISRDVAFDGGATVTSDRWRIRSSASSGGYVRNVREFRIGPAPAHQRPEFTTRAGHVASKGATVRLETRPVTSDYYTSAPYVFSFAEGTQPPQGVSLSQDGLLSVAEDADFDAMWTFTARVTDGIGWTAAREFRIAATAPQAAALMAHGFVHEDGTTEIDHRHMYDASSSTSPLNVPVSQQHGITVDFGFPVAATSASVAMWSGSSSARLKVQYEADGQWFDASATLVSRGTTPSGQAVTFTQPVVASRYRAIATTAHAMEISGFRVGSGPLHTAPTFVTPAYLATLSDEEQAPVIEAVTSPTYLNLDPEAEKTFEVVSGTLPEGTALLSDGTLELPSSLETQSLHWEFTVRATDAEGFTSDRRFVVGGAARPASQTMAASAALSDAPFERMALYDGLLSGSSAASANLTNLAYLTVTFDEPVSFSSFYHATGTRAYDLQIDAAGEWMTVMENVPVSAGTTVSLPVTYSTRQVRLLRRSSGAAYVREFRLGGGPAHSAPVIEMPEFLIAQLGDDPQTVELSGTAFTHYGDGTPVWSIASGSLPEGAALDGEGLLHLPADDHPEGDAWSFALRLTDMFGVSSSQEHTVISKTAPAASKRMARTMTLNGVPVDYRLLYDGSTATTDIEVSSADSRMLEIDFGMPVTFDSVYSASASSLILDIHTGQDWLEAVTLPANSTGAVTPVGETLVSRHFRVRRSGGSATSIRELRIGNGPAHQAPHDLTSGLVATLGAQPQQISLSATVDDHYSKLPASFAVIDGSLPSGAVLHPDGTLDLPPHSGGHGWQARVRVTDGAGFTADTDAFVAAPSVPASSTLPSAAFVGAAGSEAPMAMATRLDLVDRDASTTLSLPAGHRIVFEFGRTVRFDRLHLDASSTLMTVAVLLDDEWVAMPYAWSGPTLILPHDVTTDAVMVRRTSSNPTTVRDVLVGDGPGHSPPAIQQSGIAAVLQDTPSTLALTAAAPSAPYTDGSVTWTLVGGSLPGGGTFSSDGTVSLPAVSQVTGNMWTFSVRATDAAGYFSEGEVSVAAAEAREAATWMVEDARTGNTPVSIFRLYDGRNSSALDVKVPSGQPLVLDFGRTVRFDSVITSMSGPLAMEVEVNGAWEPVATALPNSTAIQPVGVGEWSAQRVRLVRTSATGETSLREFRIGAGGAHTPPPDETIPGFISHAPGEAPINLPATHASPYENARALSYAIVSGNLPAGAALSADGGMSAPTSSVPGGTKATIRMSDLSGAWTDREILYFIPGEEASRAYPVSALTGSTPADAFRLYDGLATPTYSVSSSQSSWIILDFGRQVTADSVYVNKSSNSSFLEIEIAGEWVSVLDMLDAEDRAVPLPTRITAQRLRITRTASSNTSVIREFRFGAGPAYAPPTVEPVVIAHLDASPSELIIPRTYDANYSGPLTFTQVSASLPSGDTLAPDGRILLPPSGSVPAGAWSIVYLGTDDNGLSASGLALVTNASGTPAATTMPVTSEPGSPTIANLHNPSTGSLSVSAGTTVTYNYASPVDVGSVQIRKSLSATHVFVLEALVSGGQWVPVAEIPVAGTDLATFELPQAVTASSFRLVAPATNTLREFRLGSGGAFPSP